MISALNTNRHIFENACYSQNAQDQRVLNKKRLRYEYLVMFSVTYLCLSDFKYGW